MRSITQHYEGKNIYTRPLQGKPYYRNSGIIYAVDRSGNKYSVARVDLERFDDQNFQYVFTPDWDTIDSLPTSIFQGIHGLDMSMRLERYYRVNMMPYFISERTPSEKREDLWELLEEVGLDYYDRFEWLLRTNMRCGTDNLTGMRHIPSCDNAHERVILADAHFSSIRRASSSGWLPGSRLSQQVLDLLV